MDKGKNMISNNVTLTTNIQTIIMKKRGNQLGSHDIKKILFMMSNNNQNNNSVNSKGCSNLIFPATHRVNYERTEDESETLSPEYRRNREAKRMTNQPPIVYGNSYEFIRINSQNNPSSSRKKSDEAEPSTLELRSTTYNQNDNIKQSPLIKHTKSLSQQIAGITRRNTLNEETDSKNKKNFSNYVFQFKLPPKSAKKKIDSQILTSRHPQNKEPASQVKQLPTNDNIIKKKKSIRQEKQQSKQQKQIPISQKSSKSQKKKIPEYITVNLNLKGGYDYQNQSQKLRNLSQENNKRRKSLTYLMLYKKKSKDQAKSKEFQDQEGGICTGVTVKAAELNNKIQQQVLLQQRLKLKPPLPKQKILKRNTLPKKDPQISPWKDTSPNQNFHQQYFQ